MCSYCRSNYKHYLIKHEEDACPFKASLYCSACACYGHSIKGCPAHTPIQPRLIRTPPKKSKPAKPILELSNDEESLKAFLQSRSRMPIRGVKTADLRKLVKQYADEKGMELSLVF